MMPARIVTARIFLFQLPAPSALCTRSACRPFPVIQMMLLDALFYGIAVKNHNGIGEIFTLPWLNPGASIEQDRNFDIPVQNDGK